MPIVCVSMETLFFPHSNVTQRKLVVFHFNLSFSQQHSPRLKGGQYLLCAGTSLIQAFGRQRQEDCYHLKASLVCNSEFQSSQNYTEDCLKTNMAVTVPAGRE